MVAYAIGDQGFATFPVDVNVTNGGAIRLDSAVTLLETGGAETRTLAAGKPGQVKILAMTKDGGDCVVTLTGNPQAFDVLTFGDVGDAVVLLYVEDTGWVILSNNGVTVA